MRNPITWLIDRRIAAFQNDTILKHSEEVQNIYRQMRGWRHDYHNHIQLMKAHLAAGRTDELGAYLDELDSDLRSVDTVIKSGNVMLDAILGSKLSLASSKGITVSAKAAAPPALGVSDVDLCAVLGNLLDNAIESCQRQEGDSECFIRVYIGTFKGQFYISVSNSSGGKAKRTAGRYRSSKGGTHGFGLMRIDRVVNKYGGYINRQSEEGVFATEVMLPL